MSLGISNRIHSCVKVHITMDLLRVLRISRSFQNRPPLVSPEIEFLPVVSEISTCNRHRVLSNLLTGSHLASDPLVEDPALR